MALKIIFIYCLVSDLLKQLSVKEDCRSLMSNAEVVTTIIVAAVYFQGNHQKAQRFLLESGYIPNMLSKSRFNRRFHALGWEFLVDMQNLLGSVLKQGKEDFTVDSFPVPICHNIRIPRCRLVHSEEFRGYTASKKMYFYGVKVHVIATCDGIPVEVFISPGSWHDMKAFKEMEVDLPEGSTLHADKAYTDYSLEELLREASDIDLAPQRKPNHTRQHSCSKAFLIDAKRKVIETIFSCITGLFPKSIHAITLEGFLIKVTAFVLSFTLAK